MILFGSFVAEDVHHFYFLGVVGGESHENQNPRVSGDPIDGFALQEQVDQGGDDDPDQAHEQKTAPRGEVFFRSIPIKAHGAKSAGGNQKRGRDRRRGVSQKDKREGDAV